MLLFSYLRMCTYKTAVSLKAGPQHYFHPNRENRRLNALIDWLYAQDSYIPLTQLRPEYLHPSREGPPLYRQLGCSSLLCHDGGWGVEFLHVVDARMMMLKQHILVPGPMFKARCGLRMRKMRPGFPLTSCMWVSVGYSYGKELDGPHLQPWIP